MIFETTAAHTRQYTKHISNAIIFYDPTRFMSLHLKSVTLLVAVCMYEYKKNVFVVFVPYYMINKTTRTNIWVRRKYESK